MKISKKEIYKRTIEQLKNIKNYLTEINSIYSEIGRLHEEYSSLLKQRRRNSDCPFFHDKLTGRIFLREEF